MANIIPTTSDAARREEPPDLARLHVDLMQQVGQTDGFLETTQGLLRIARELTNAAAVMYFDRAAVDRQTPSAVALTKPCPVRLDTAPAVLVPGIRRTIEEQRVQVMVFDDYDGLSAVLAPVLVEDGVTDVLAVFLLLGDEPLESFVVVLQMIAGYIALAGQKARGSQAVWEAEQTAAILELISRLADARNLRDAGFRLVNEVQRHLGCKEVAIGLRRGRRCRLLAVSGRSEVDIRTDSAQVFEAVFGEALLTGEPTSWTAASNRPATEAHRVLCQERRAGAVYSGVLAEGEHEPRWVLVALADQEWTPRQTRFLDAASMALAGPLRLLASKGVLKAIPARRGGWRRKLAWLAIPAAIIGALWLPVPFRVAGDATV